MLDGRRAHLLHDAHQFGPQQLQDALDAGLAEGAEPPDVGPSDADRGRAHAQRLADVGAAAEAGVNQDRDAAVDSFDDFRQRIDGGAAGVFAAGAMVRHDDAVIAVVGRELRVFPGQQPLDDDFHLGDVAQALEVVPRHGRRLDVAQPGQIDALVHGLVALIGLDIGAIMAVAALAVVGSRQPEQSLLVAPSGTIDRDGEGRTAGILGALDVVRCDLELVGRVKLHPDRPAPRLDHILDAGRRLGGEDHEMIARLRGPGDA